MPVRMETVSPARGLKKSCKNIQKHKRHSFIGILSVFAKNKVIEMKSVQKSLTSEKRTANQTYETRPQTEQFFSDRGAEMFKHKQKCVFKGPNISANLSDGI